MLCWEKHNRTLIPDDSVNSSSISEVNQFFERCVELFIVDNTCIDEDGNSF
jgi:hypothetical protein